MEINCESPIIKIWCTSVTVKTSPIQAQQNGIESRWCEWLTVLRSMEVEVMCKTDHLVHPAGARLLSDDDRHQHLLHLHLLRRHGVHGGGDGRWGWLRWQPHHFAPPPPAAGVDGRVTQAAVQHHEQARVDERVHVGHMQRHLHRQHKAQTHFIRPIMHLMLNIFQLKKWHGQLRNICYIILASFS